MNNLSTVGVYLNALQQNVTGLSLGLKDLRKDIEELKSRQAPSPTPTQVDSKDARDTQDLEAVKARVTALEDAIGSLQSIFTSLPPPPAIAETISQQPMEVADVAERHSLPLSAAENHITETDIELVPKAAPSIKKKPAKKK